MECECSHMPWQHSLVTYPSYRRPCSVCLSCGRAQSPGKVCCLTPQPCPCRNLETAHAC